MLKTLEYKTKLVISGHFLEKIVYPDLFLFPRPLALAFCSLCNGRCVHRSAESRRSSLCRARVGLRRLIFSNAWRFRRSWGQSYPPVFLTLTNADNVRDLDEGNLAFKKFVMRLNYQENLSLRYVQVPEFQARGSVHHHALLFNFPWISLDRIRWIWGRGEQVNIQSLRSLRAAGNYLLPYLSKGGGDVRFFRKRRYSPSEGLFKPLAIDYPSDSLLARLPRMQEFPLKYGGSYASSILDSPLVI